MAKPDQNSSELNMEDRQYGRPVRLLTLILLLLVPSSFLLSLCVGSLNIPFQSVLASIVGADDTPAIETVVHDIRLPRSLLAGLIGGVLAICGAACQGLFRNPLADPSLIGVTAGASAGAAIAIYFASSAVSYTHLTLPTIA